MANLVVKADGVVSGPEMEFLSYYETMLRSGWTETHRVETVPAPAFSSPLQRNPAQQNGTAPSPSQARSVAPTAQASPERPLDAVLGELNGLIGLRQVKAEVARLVAFLQVEQLKRSRGLKSAELSLHMEFYGNPGTGKTTVARLMAQIYRALGFVSRGHLIEADRSKLIGAWLGQTAIKTSEMIEQALGGVLFIDEAYSLARTEAQEDIYGKEAIETILKSMEDHRDDLVVIVAGYPDEMAKFFASNPGLKSRFNRFINFEDYSAEELFQIFSNFANNSQYKISLGAAEKLQKLFANAHKNRDRNFGNGRFARNLFESSIQQQAMRIVGLTRVNNETLMTIEAVDLPEPETMSAVVKKKAPVGFEVPQQVATREEKQSQPTVPADLNQLAINQTDKPRHRRNFDIDDLKHDPQEDDPRLMAFFDAAQKEAEDSMCGFEHRLGYGQMLTSRMQAILKEKYGIEWKTPSQMNPGWHLD